MRLRHFLLVVMAGAIVIADEYAESREQTTATDAHYAEVDDKPSSAEWEQYHEELAKLAHLEKLAASYDDPARADSRESTAGELLKLMNTTHTPERVALKLQEFSLSVMQEAATRDMSCSKRSLEDARTSNLWRMEKLDQLDSVKYRIQGLQRPDQSTIRPMIEETRKATAEYIAEFKNRCWDFYRVDDLIKKALKNDTDGNVTVRAEYIIAALSKWHTNDKFVVVAKEVHCNQTCGVQEAAKKPTIWRHKSSKQELDTSVSVRTAVSSDEWSGLRAQMSLFKEAGKRTDGTCFYCNAFVNHVENFVHVSARNDNCAPVILNTHPDTVFTKTLCLNSGSSSRTFFTTIMAFKK